MVSGLPTHDANIAQSILRISRALITAAHKGFIEDRCDLFSHSPSSPSAVRLMNRYNPIRIWHTYKLVHIYSFSFQVIHNQFHNAIATSWRVVNETKRSNLELLCHSPLFSFQLCLSIHCNLTIFLVMYIFSLQKKFRKYSAWA